MKPHGVRPAAADAWDDLQAALRETTTPCQGPNAAWWTSDDGDERHAAALHCQQCPVLDICDAYAAANREKDGFVWGGRTR
ncbi:WhiB family transcriptional regulator [Brevibacterium yomogidense]|uniref:WhiB family transcriptional regulator n=1 Tax=Brevibacterium yomogidense TaxID=946573 RepID=UPI0018E00588